MRWTRVLIGSLVGVVLVGGLGTAHRFWPHSAWAGTHGWHHHDPVSGHHAGFGHFGALCGAGSDALIDDALGHLRDTLKPSETQETALRDFGAALKRGSTRLAASCPAPASAITASGTLADTEAMLAAGLEAVRIVRPAFDALHATLDASQRARLDALFAMGPHT